MRDIVVTTPQAQRARAAEEAAACRAAGGGAYFRVLRTRPKDFGVGSRVFYVEAGYVRGYGVVERLRVWEDAQGWVACDVTGRRWTGRLAAWMPATSWRWVRPVPMAGFQGWRY